MALPIIRLGPAHLPNCGVTALAIIVGMPFQVVFETMLIRNRKRGNWKGRTHEGERLRALEWYGFKADYCKGPGTVEEWAGILPHDGELYLMSIPGHCFVYCDGHMIDQHIRDWLPVSSYARRRSGVRSLLQCYVPLTLHAA
jgi:hypothetical protein